MQTSSGNAKRRRWLWLGLGVGAGLLALPLVAWVVGKGCLLASTAAAQRALQETLDPRATPDALPDDRPEPPLLPDLPESEFATDAYAAAADWIWKHELAPTLDTASPTPTTELDREQEPTSERLEAEAGLLELLHIAARRRYAAPRPRSAEELQSFPQLDFCQLTLRRAAERHGKAGDHALRAHCIATLLQVLRDAFDHEHAPCWEPALYETVAHWLARTLAELPLPEARAARLASFAAEVDRDWPGAHGAFLANTNRYPELVRGYLDRHPSSRTWHSFFTGDLWLSSAVDAGVDLAALIARSESLPWPEAKALLRDPPAGDTVPVADVDELFSLLERHRHERTWLRVIAHLLHLHAGLEPPAMASRLGGTITSTTDGESGSTRIVCAPELVLEFPSSLLPGRRGR